MLKTLSINDVDLSTFGIYLQSDTYLNAPSFDYVEYAVPARDGNLLSYNKRMNNVIRRFDCLIKDNVQSGMDALKKLIYSNAGYVKLSTSYEPDFYQEGYLAQEIEATPFKKDDALSVQFSLYFSCKPQKFFTREARGSFEPEFSEIPTEVQGIYTPEQSKVVAAVLSRMEEYDIPDTKYYVVIRVISTRANQLTDVYGESLDGGVVAIIYNDGAQWYETPPVWNGNYSTNGRTRRIIVSPTISGNYVNVWMVVPLSLSGQYVAHYTDTEEHTVTVNMGNMGFTLTNTNAVGMEVGSLGFMLRAQIMGEDNADAVENAFFIEGRKDGKRTFLARVSVPLTNYTAAELETLLSRYYVEFDQNTDYHLYNVDSDYNVRIRSMNAGHLMEIEGDISGICDSYSMLMVKAPITETKYIGQALGVTASIRWWKV